MDTDLRSLGAELSNWGRWGPDDQLGTVNHLTDAHREAAARLVRRGRLVDLGLPLQADGPQTGGGRFNPIHRMTSIPGDGERPGGMIASDDVVTMPLQCATQWDGLAHVGYDGLLWNGVPAGAVTASRGVERNGFEQVAPHLVGRGVLLDVARLKGVETLAAGEEITPDDLDAACAAQGVEVGTGDLLLVRTGWFRHAAARDWTTYMASSVPGLGLECCRWLAEREVAAVAADTYIVEVLPSRCPPAAYPFHMVAIRDLGLTLGEMFDLEALSALCAADGVWEFLLLGAGLKITGSTGSPVLPLALL